MARKPVVAGWGLDVAEPHFASIVTIVETTASVGYRT